MISSQVIFNSDSSHNSSYRLILKTEMLDFIWIYLRRNILRCLVKRIYTSINCTNKVVFKILLFNYTFVPLKSVHFHIKKKHLLSYNCGVPLFSKFLDVGYLFLYLFFSSNIITSILISSVYICKIYTYIMFKCQRDIFI